MVQRRMRPDERRRVVLRAAAEAFAEHGAAGATLDDVAHRAGVTKTLLYRHARSKDDLYAAALEAQADELAVAVGVALPAGDRLDAAGARAVLDAFLAFVETRPFARQLLFRDPEAGAATTAVHERVQARLTGALARALLADPTLLAGDPAREQALELAAQLLKTGLNGVAAWWWAHQDMSREAVADRALALLWPGIEALRA